jgi:hypothetical protein
LVTLGYGHGGFTFLAMVYFGSPSGLVNPQRVASGFYPHAVGVRDPEGDSRDRIFLGLEIDGVDSLLRLEALNGTVTAMTVSPSPGVNHSLRFTPPMDLDADGRQEFGFTAMDSSLVMTETFRETAWWEGTNPVVWWNRSDLSDPRSTLLPTAASGSADVNLDGLPDLILTPDGEDRSVHVHLATSLGVFESNPLKLPLGGAFGESYSPRWEPLPVPPVDLDGDGLVDVLAIVHDEDSQNRLRLYRWSSAMGGPDPVPSEVLDIDLDVEILRALAVDLDQDGLQDLYFEPSHGTGLILWGGSLQGCADGSPRQLAFPDEDGDGYASSVNAGWWCVPPPGSQPSPGSDCDDALALVFPGSTAVGLKVDADCDGLSVCGVDTDRDGYVVEDVWTHPTHDCRWGRRRAIGAVGESDCDDNNRRVYPGSFMTTVGADSDCDGLLTCYEDRDGDGAAVDLLTDETVDLAACVLSRPAEPDCDDLDPAVSPMLIEVVGGPDEDCDGLFHCWADGDGDGWGLAGLVYGLPLPCDLAPSGSEVDGDCDDTSPGVYPGAPELAFGVDQDCDGLMRCYVDADHDGFGAALTDAAACSNGFSDREGDCDDTDSTRRPDRAEDYATPGDDNCNGTTAPTLSLNPLGLGFDVQDAPARWQLGVAWSATSSPGASCPPFLQGSCLDLVSPRFIGPQRTDLRGVATIQTPRAPRSGWTQLIGSNGYVGPLTAIP